MVATATKCLVCKRDDRYVVRTGVRHEPERLVYGCATCGLQWLEQDFDVSDYYASGEYRVNHSGIIGKQLTPAERFEQYRPFMDERRDDPHVHWDKSWDVVDVGCSSGYFLDSIESYVLYCAGIEINQEDRDYCWDNDIICQDSWGGISSGTFDCVCAFNVVEHQADPLAFLKELREHVTKEGYLYLETPNLHDSMLRAYKNERYAGFWYRKPHLWYFDRSTLNRLLVQAGFAGEIWSVQDFSMMNHMNWLLNGTPSPTLDVGMNVFQIADGGPSKDDVNEFLRDADETYRHGLGKLGIGNRLRAWVRPI